MGQFTPPYDNSDAEQNAALAAPSGIIRIACPACSSEIKIYGASAAFGYQTTCSTCCKQFTVTAEMVIGAPKVEAALETATTGAKRSSLYPPGTSFPARYDLMMRNAAGMRRLAEAYGEGVAKYGPDNWMQGFPASVFISHALEHIRLYLAGDTSEDHLAHCAWNLLTLAWVEENKPELLDLSMPVQTCFQTGQDPKPKQ